MRDPPQVPTSLIPGKVRGEGVTDPKQRRRTLRGRKGQMLSSTTPSKLGQGGAGGGGAREVAVTCAEGSATTRAAASVSGPARGARPTLGCQLPRPAHCAGSAHCCAPLRGRDPGHTCAAADPPSLLSAFCCGLLPVSWGGGGGFPTLSLLISVNGHLDLQHRQCVLVERPLRTAACIRWVGVVYGKGERESPVILILCVCLFRASPFSPRTLLCFPDLNSTHSY